MFPIVKRPWKPSRRNIEVLAAVCSTGSRKDAARALVDETHPTGISYRVVEAHMTRLRIGSHAVSDSQLCLLYHNEIIALLDVPE